MVTRVNRCAHYSAISHDDDDDYDYGNDDDDDGDDDDDDDGDHDGDDDEDNDDDDDYSSILALHEVTLPIYHQLVADAFTLDKNKLNQS